MQSTLVRRSIRVVALAAILGATAFVFFRAGAHSAKAQTTGPLTQKLILDNDRVGVRIVTFAPGFKGGMHSTGNVGDNRYDLMVLLSNTKVEGNVDGKITVSDKIGTIWEIHGPPSLHGFTNLSDKTVEFMVIQAKK